MIRQDDAAEKQIINICSLIKNEVRDGVDAFDERGTPFEIKSTTKKSKSVSTARDVHLHTIERWRGQHWIMAAGSRADAGLEITDLYLAHPDDLEPFFKKCEEKIKTKFDLVSHFIWSNQTYSTEKKNEAIKVVKRGSTLNDPTIPWRLIRENCVRLPHDDHEKTAAAIRQCILSRPIKSKTAGADIPPVQITPPQETK